MVHDRVATSLSSYNDYQVNALACLPKLWVCKTGVTTLPPCSASP